MLPLLLAASASLLLLPISAWLQPSALACTSASSPRWPFAYARVLGGASVGVGAWERKGRSTSSAQWLGHACAVRGAGSMCHVCERQACGAGLNESCELQLQGADWARLPRNAPTLSDAPFAVGSRVRHRYDWAAAERACLLLSSADGACTAAAPPSGALSTAACALRCWGADGGGAPPSVTEDGWTWPAADAAAGAVSTLAGGGGPGYLDAVGRAARFNAPQGVAVDGETGDVYVADTGNHVIRVVAVGGGVRTLAGRGGVAGWVDGIGTAAQFASPMGIALYRDCGARLAQDGCALAVIVADTGNHRLRLVSAVSGVVSTLAGGGGATSAADLATPPFGFADGIGTAARFDTPQGVAADAEGNVFVADTRNNALRWVDLLGAVRTLLVDVESPTPAELPGCPPPCHAGMQGLPARGGAPSPTNASALHAPISVALGPGQPYTLLVTDGRTLRLLSRSGQAAFPAAASGASMQQLPPSASAADILALDTVTSLAGAADGSGGEEDGDSGGPGTLGRLDAPRGVTMTAGDARIYVADAARCRVRALTAVSVAARPALCSDIAAALLLAPPGCSQALPPRDALHRMASPVAGGGMQHLQRGVRAGLSNGTADVRDGAAWMELDGRLVPHCLGDAPPDIGMTSSGAWLSVTGGTNASLADVDEDTAAGTATYITCPPGCAALQPTAVAGDGQYSMDSPLCAAAVHAGVLSDGTGGTLRAVLQKGVGSRAGRASPWQGRAIEGTLRHGIASAPLMEATRTFFMEPITEPRGRFVLSTVAGAPAAPLDTGCGNADASPPTAAQLDGPSALAAVPAGGALALLLVIADARGHAIRGLSAACAAPCQNGGVCLAADLCACTRGWAGADCTRPLCESGCGARRLCSGPQQCTCLPGYAGAACEVPLCAQACAHGGICAAPDTCACARGWFDPNCTTPVCAQTCGNGGNCTAADTCTCPSWWGGADCRTPLCAEGCSGHGACVAPGSCACEAGWDGPQCASPVCQQGFWRLEEVVSAGASSGGAAPVERAPRFLPCDYDAWCSTTKEAACLAEDWRRGLRPAEPPADRSVSGWAAAPSPRAQDGCLVIELDKGMRSPFRLEAEAYVVGERGDTQPITTGYARLSAVRQYGWGPPPPGGHPWSAPGPARSDRQIALVSYLRPRRGRYVCANGGACTAPNVCACAAGWVGFDCRTPVCTQGFFYLAQGSSPAPIEGVLVLQAAGDYRPTSRTLTLWERPASPAGRFEAYMHDHPNFHSLQRDGAASAGLTPAYVRVAGHGNATNEGWRREGWYARAPSGGSGGALAPWTPGNATAPGYIRRCGGGAAAPVDLRISGSNSSGASPGGGCSVNDTMAAFAPRVRYNDTCVVSAAGRWEAGAEGWCVDEVQRGCFNGGACVAPDTCACAAGWAGEDCSLPMCDAAVGAVGAAAVPSLTARAVLLRAPSATGAPPRAAGAPLGVGDSWVQYFACPHRGNCTQPGVCTCEKGWAGADCRQSLCAQECLNGGRCVAPDTCECLTWPSAAGDARGVPTYQQPNGDAALTGWTGFDCGTPLCAQAREWVPNDDTGHRLITLAASANDGRSFQGGCGPALSRYAVSSSHVSAQWLCGLTAWWQGEYAAPWANGDASAAAGSAVGGGPLSVSAAGRSLRLPLERYVATPRRNGSGSGLVWAAVVPAPRPGEGLYACANRGSCVAPDTCVCAEGWAGTDCSQPLCRHVGRRSGRLLLGCGAHGGMCAGKDTCACPTSPSLLWQVHADAPPAGTLTGWAGARCSKPICTQGSFVETCTQDPDDEPGCWACAHGGNCTAPDTCACTPAWGGFDCRTPRCVLRASTLIISQLGTLDAVKIEAFERDPCGSTALVLAAPKGDGAAASGAAGGRRLPRGTCMQPGVCSCLCRSRTSRDASGNVVATPWRSPFGLPPPVGAIYGDGDCLDGFQGAPIPGAGGESYTSCHLRIYVPTWLERNAVAMLASGTLAVAAAIAIHLLLRVALRRRMRKLKALRRARRQEQQVVTLPGPQGQDARKPEPRARRDSSGGGAFSHAVQPPMLGGVMRRWRGSTVAPLVG